jgi:glycosyltransferase involved in cell wall biosynthesis
MPTILNSAEKPEQILDRCKVLSRKFLEFQGSESSNVIVICAGLSSAQIKTYQQEAPFTIYSVKGPTIFPFRYLMKSISILRKYRGKEVTLIAGDNYLALFISLLLKSLLGSKAKVQVSIHGNPLLQKSNLLKGFARKMAFKLLLPKASSARFVSEHLRRELSNYISPDAYSFVSPIQVQFHSNLRRVSVDRTLGLVGRLHEERGIDFFCEILEKVSEEKLSYKFIVIGDGPERKMVEDFCFRHTHVAVDLKGNLLKSKVLESYQSMNLLLSCAPSEGYGLALREAILSGTPVVVRSNEGTRELKSIFNEMVYLFDSVDEAVLQVESCLKTAVSTEVVEKYRAIQSRIEEASVQALINSWH